MSKPRGSGRSWRERQERDPYVQQARREGWRSRAVFKLQEIDQKERLLRPGMTCVDLGAAPGGWSQYVTTKLKGKARVVAIDLLPMDALPDTDFIQGDFTEDAVLEELRALVGEQKVDLVMSDLAPNISGNRAIDQPRAMYLAELALEFAREVLAKRGDFVIKLFQGEGIDPFMADVRSSFTTVKVKKPKASRAGSREVYLVARNYRL
ncbi:MAG: 23S rRNA (uridine(2552)-2'-O)-methyltransferase RlmE [Woeseiaceae bacterium]